MNLIKLHGHYGKMFWVDSAQLSDLNRIQLSIYTSRGNKLYDVLERAGKLKSYPHSTTVHRENLFASRELAKAHEDAIYSDMRKRSEAAHRAVGGV